MIDGPNGLQINFGNDGKVCNQCVLAKNNKVNRLLKIKIIWILTHLNGRM